MTSNRSLTNWLLYAVGGAPVIISAILAKNAPIVVAVCIGVGLITQLIRHLATARYLASHPAQAKQHRVDAHDERTSAITARAKAKALDLTIILLVAFAYIQILTDAPLWQTLTTVAIYVLGHEAQRYYAARLDREM